MAISDSNKAVFLKAAGFCAYQERTQQEVRDRLYEWGLYQEAVEEIIAELIGENFINEERFAKTYAGSKFRIKKWGRLKIEKMLKEKKLSPYCIRQGMAEINEEEYLHTIQELLQKKLKELGKEKNEYIRKNKAVRFLLSKGYESSLVWDQITLLESE